MFCVIYRFKVKDGLDAQLVDSWGELTEFIYHHCGSLGSRLHKSQNHNEYIAYAQWPSKDFWEAGGSDEFKLAAENPRQAMRDACDEIETLFELNPVSDMLKNAPHIQESH